MKEDKDITTRIPRSDGMTVPDGYFADFAARMADSLEVTPFEESLTHPVYRPRTLWQRIRPYAYLAAMFAGVWCMLKMFTLMTGHAPAGLESSPAIAEAMGNEVFVNDYILNGIDQWDLYDEMLEEGVDIEAFCDSIDEIYLTNQPEQNMVQ